MTQHQLNSIPLEVLVLNTLVAAADLGLKGPVDVFDIWAQKGAGTFTGSYTAKGVAVHGTAFLRLSVGAK